MQMLYNSDAFVVVRFDVPSGEPGTADAGVAGAGDSTASVGRGGYEIVDKLSRKEIYLEGAVAESFKSGVQALADSEEASPEAFDEFIARYAVLAQHPVVMH